MNENDPKFIRASRLAEIVSGSLKGDPQKKITGAAGIGHSGPRILTFAENKQLLEKAVQAEAGLVIIPEEISEEDYEIDVLKVDNPRLAYARAARFFAPRPYYNPGVDDSAEVSNSASLGHEVSIHPGVVVDDRAIIGDEVILAPGVYVGAEVEIGDFSVIHPRAVIGHGTSMGCRVEIGPGSVVGSDGFGYVWSGTENVKIPQLGKVKIEDNVEIGACVCIDRAVSGTTVIKKGTKIDNLVQIAHNVCLGEDNLIAGQTGIAGSSKTGDRVTTAGQVGVVDHVSLGDEITVGGKGMVSKDLQEKGFYSGIPAQKHRQELKERASLRRLPELKERIKELEQEVQELKEKKSDK